MEQTFPETPSKRGGGWCEPSGAGERANFRGARLPMAPAFRCEEQRRIPGVSGT
ncbi:hypothetical protein [Acutalibacter sp. 1XD8-36]|uniref:hypothetical protein n=1 Tax=Acutalibacter sp. 1XD8-36 TaxID=2320852 RepID=UPI001413291B|nr:hypothetical protein [Acutalibacter sp. 1XD8-36]